MILVQSVGRESSLQGGQWQMERFVVRRLVVLRGHAVPVFCGGGKLVGQGQLPFAEVLHSVPLNLAATLHFGKGGGPHQVVRVDK